MIKKTLINILIILVIFDIAFASDREDCFDELSLYHNFGDLNYSEYSKGFSNFHNLDDPFLSLVFSEPIVVIRFNNIGKESSLKVGNWPTYREYNFFELYIDKPNSFDFDFAGCGYLKIEALGSYKLDTLNVNRYKQQVLDSYKFNIDQDKSKYRIFETEHETLDINDDPFLKMNTFRVYHKDTNLYFKQYDILDNYRNALEKFKSGDLTAMVDYNKAIVNSGQDYAKYLRDYALFRDLNYNSGINTDKTPLNYVPPIPITYVPANTDKIINLNNIQDSIEQLNLELLEMENLGYLAPTTKVQPILNNEFISKDRFYEINGKIKTLLNLVSKGDLFVELELDDIIYKKDYDVIINNLNTYLSVKYCNNADFGCGNWGVCSASSSSTRTVNKNRICIGSDPRTTVSCSWKLQTIGPTYDIPNGCTSDIYRDNIYYDIFGTWFADYCGVFSLAQWMGHSKTMSEYVGSSDNCGGGNDGGGGN